jgi:DNA-binding XRE family transcriptional regulator
MSKLNTNITSNDDLLAKELANDPAFQYEWDRLEFARLVAAKVIEYRAEVGITQRALANQLGIPQSQIARLEGAEHQPSYETLARLTTLGMEFDISFRPRTPSQTSRRRRKRVSLSVKTSGGSIRYTAV